MATRQLKYYDIQVVGSVVALASYNILSTIPQGVAQSQRVGDKVRLVRASIHLNISTANSDVFNTVRLIWFRWIPNTASLTPGSGSILENPTTQGVLSHYNYEGRKEYQILKDELLSMTGTGTNPTVNSNIVQRFNIPLNFDVVYNVSATTGTCHLYCLNMSDSAVTPYPELNYWCRLWYLD